MQQFIYLLSIHNPILEKKLIEWSKKIRHSSVSLLNQLLNPKIEAYDIKKPLNL